MSENPALKPKLKICEACGKEFSCGAAAGLCWCFEFELKEETLAKLESDFKNCLCADCLNSYVKKEK